MDGPTVDRLAVVRARSILSQLGVAQGEPVYRVPSVTNEVWCTADLVVRVNRRADGRLAREVVIAERLPACLGYPEIVESGTSDGMDWMVTRRLPGVALSRVWPRITDEERHDLSVQFAERLAALHATTAEGIPPLTSTPQLIQFEQDEPLAPLRHALVEVYQLDHVPKRLIRDIAGQVEDAAPSFRADRPSTIIHGDLTFENVLYHEGEITTFLDFEWCRAAPPDVDLDVLLRFISFPKLHVAADYEAITDESQYRSIPRVIESTYPELFAGTDLRARLLTYCISYDVRDLLRHPPRVPMDQLADDHPLRRLSRTASGTSHLHQLTDRR